jgi:hypothetical protein
MVDATVKVVLPDRRRIVGAEQQRKNGVAHQCGKLYE